MILFYPVYGLLWLISWLPLSVLYIVSDLAYYIVYYLVGYRRHVVRKNLTRSFHGKSKEEIIAIEKKFYRFLCDMFVEVIHEMNISLDEISKRMTFTNVDAILEQYQVGKSSMVMTAHFGNWEWMIHFATLFTNGKGSSHIYKQQRNQRIDKLIYKMRHKFGNGYLIEKKDLLRVMFDHRKKNILTNYWMISDQTPNAHSIHYRTQFLNQDTPAIVGTEVLARKFDFPVFYAEVSRIRRGYYNCHFVPVDLQPNDSTNYEITEKYMQLLEKTITKQPELWLWSHRRWKHSNDE